MSSATLVFKTPKRLVAQNKYFIVLTYSTDEEFVIAEMACPFALCLEHQFQRLKVWSNWMDRAWNYVEVPLLT